MANHVSVEEHVKARAQLLKASGTKANLEKLHTWWNEFEISPEDQKQWQRLVRRLAKKYLQSIATKKANPSFWTPARELMFYDTYVYIKQQDPKKSDAEICKTLKDKWDYKRTDLDALKNRLSSIKRRFRKSGII